MAELDIAVMVTGHGVVYAREPAARWMPFVVRRADPNRLIREKLAFLRWSRQMLNAGERRGLPYGVIEACLFPWSSPWTWRNWFRDEASRLFSAGEFSRTHYVRALADRTHMVPPRFPTCWRMVRRFGLRHGTAPATL